MGKVVKLARPQGAAAELNMIQKVCVSLSTDQVRYIERQNGVSFSEKLRRIIDRDCAREDLAAIDNRFVSGTITEPEQLRISFEE